MQPLFSRFLVLCFIIFLADFLLFMDAQTAHGELFNSDNWGLLPLFASCFGLYLQNKQTNQET